MDKALNKTVSSGGYSVDIERVALAMLTRPRIRQVASGVLPAPQPIDLASICIPEDEALAVLDAA